MTNIDIFVLWKDVEILLCDNAIQVESILGVQIIFDHIQEFC